MKILYIYNFFKKDLGYIENYLPREIAKLGNEVIVIIPRSVNLLGVFLYKDSAMMLLQEKTGKGLLSIMALPGLPFFGPSILPIMPALLQILLRFRPEIINCTYLNPNLLILIPFKKIFKYKIIVTIGMPIDISQLSKVNSFLYVLFKRFINPLLEKYIDLFIEATHENMKRDIEEFRIAPSKVHFLPLGVDTLLFRKDHLKREQIRKTLGVGRDEIVYIYSSYMITPEKEKAIETLIDVFARLLKLHKKAKLLIIGNSSIDFLLRIQQKISNYGINKNIILLKSVPHHKLIDYYSAADIAIWPSGPSISIQESMASGLPIIVKKSGHVFHLLKYRNSFLFNDVNDLYLYMEKLYTNSELREKLGAMNRKLAEDELDWAVIAKKWNILYLSLTQSIKLKRSLS